MSGIFEQKQILGDIILQGLASFIINILEVNRTISKG